MGIKNAKSQSCKHPSKPKPTSSSSKSSRSNSVQKSDLPCGNSQAPAQLDVNSIHPQSGILEGETGDCVLEEEGIIEGTRGTDLPSESVELTAVTLHQPWASLIAEGKKHYETRSWATDYRGPIAIHAAKKLHEDESLISLLEVPTSEIPLGAIVAIAQLTDCILMDEEFILKQSSFEQYLGLWEVGRYAWKLENVRAIEPIAAAGKQGLWKWNQEAAGFNSLEIYPLEPWNPTDFGEVQHKAEPNGQLNLLEFDSNEPPEPDDYPGDLEAFKKAYLAWVELQEGTAEEEYQHTTAEEIWNQSGNGNGSICAQELAQDSPTQELNCGDDRPISSASEMNIAGELSTSDSPAGQSQQMLNEVIGDSLTQQILSPPHHPVNHSQPKENVSEPKTIETVSQQSLLQLESYNQNLQLSKTSLDFSTALIDQEAISCISPESLSIFPRAGTMQNGSVSAAQHFLLPGCEPESLLLRSPGALSSTGAGRPPGKNKLDYQLMNLGLLTNLEVTAPEFLEFSYNLPLGFSNPAETRTALELSQVQAQLSSNLELQAETEPTAIEEQPWAMPLTGESQPLVLSELNISVTLPPNIGALSKAELIGMASEQHQLICGIERKKFKLAFEKLYRIHVTGLFLMEFKKRCQYGEFVEQLEVHGINPRVAQNYTMVSKNWKTIEAKAHQSALLSENNESPNLGINWALQVIREEKKQLKSAAPPKDPDSWRTPNTKDQPVVALVQQALGGSIWLDPCSGSVTNNIPCAVRYFKDDNGLAQHQTWSKTVFINPPFSDPLPWVERCCFEIARGNVSAAVMLLKSGTISNLKTGELINKYASAICHWRGRINFLNDEGNAVKGSDFDCVFVYFGARLDLFRQAFQQRGTIATIDNHYSSVNKKFLEDAALPEPQTLKSEQKQLAVAVGLSNGKSVLPDMRDSDRERMERYDPHTVLDLLSSSMPTTPAKPVPVSENLVEPLAEPEIFDETPLATRQLQKAKENCLNDYVTAISSNLSEFSDEQIAFLAKIINEESAKRIGF